MSTVSATLSARPVTLEQLAALSDEIGALARAGVPLDRGLRELALDMPGRLGRLAGEISRELEQGRSLEQAVASLGSALPPAYQAVIVAGVRAGRLPAAMEGISQTARRIGQLRGSIYLALVYPFLVLLVASQLGAFILWKIVPVLSMMMVEFDVGGPWMVAGYKTAAQNAYWLGPALPLLLLAWFAWIWYRTGKLAEGQEIHPLLTFGAVGTLARLQRAGRLASLSELMSLMIANSVPLPEAVGLSASAVGSRRLAKSGQALAEKLRRGESIDKPPAGFPPLLAWTIANGQSPWQMARSLARSAEIYRDEVAFRSQWLVIYVPLFATVVVCGGMVCLYAAITLGPWLAMLYRLSLPY